MSCFQKNQTDLAESDKTEVWKYLQMGTTSWRSLSVSSSVSKNLWATRSRASSGHGCGRGEERSSCSIQLLAVSLLQNQFLPFETPEWHTLGPARSRTKSWYKGQTRQRGHRPLTPNGTPKSFQNATRNAHSVVKFWKTRSPPTQKSKSNGTWKYRLLENWSSLLRKQHKYFHIPGTNQ